MDEIERKKERLRRMLWTASNQMIPQWMAEEIENLTKELASLPQ